LGKFWRVLQSKTLIHFITIYLFWGHLAYLVYTWYVLRSFGRSFLVLVSKIWQPWNVQVGGKKIVLDNSAWLKIDFIFFGCHLYFGSTITI
jgi:hypothetical protein